MSNVKETFCAFEKLKSQPEMVEAGEISITERVLRNLARNLLSIERSELREDNRENR